DTLGLRRVPVVVLAPYAIGAEGAVEVDDHFHRIEGSRRRGDLLGADHLCVEAADRAGLNAGLAALGVQAAPALPGLAAAEGEQVGLEIEHVAVELEVRPRAEYPRRVLAERIRHIDDAVFGDGGDLDYRRALLL